MKLSTLCKNEKRYNCIILEQKKDRTWQAGIIKNLGNVAQKITKKYKTLEYTLEDDLFRKTGDGYLYCCITPRDQPVNGFYINVYKMIYPLEKVTIEELQAEIDRRTK
jgi:hypothetical protein